MRVMSLLSTKRIIIGVGALFLSIGVAGAVDAATTTKTSSGVVCTKVGTAGSDVLTGTAGIDVICGLGGYDTINGLAGNDIIDGGVGNDVINAGDGNDSVYGGVGDDKLRGDAGNDTINGDAGKDTETGGLGNDGLSGGLGDDSVSGGDGVDTLNGNDGTDVLSGDAGNDTINGDAGNDTETGGLGDDGLSGGLGDDSVSGGDGVDTLNGNDGTDVLSGDAGNDTANGGAGDDTVSGGLGNDTVSGDAGNDTETGGDGTDTMRGGDGNDNLQGGVGNDSFYGDAGDDTLFGGDGTDTIRGGDGNDSAYGENGNDTVTGSLGNDVLNGGEGDDTVSGETGNDKVYGGDGADILAGNTGNDTITGDAGNDTIGGGDGTDNLSGGAGDDSLAGNAGDDTIYGNDGIDALAGGDGNDGISGGIGNDTLLGDSGNDVLSGNSGNDSVSGGDGNDSETGGDGNDRMVGDAGNDSMKGEAGNDGLIGGDGTDTLAGANGTPAQNERNLCERDANDTVTYCGFDENAPYIQSAELSRTSVDSSSGAQTVVVTLHVTDELMGTSQIGCSLIWDGARNTTGYDRAVRVSGDAIDGVYTCNVTIPFGGASGRWGLTLDTRDRAGNLGIAEQSAWGKWHSNLPEVMAQTPEHWIEQTGAGDSQSPRIIDPTVNVTTIDTSASDQTVTVEARITDDFTGVKRVQCAPRHGIAIDFTPGYGGAQATLKTGDANDGVWTCTMKLPKGAGHGKWGVALFASDGMGTYYSVETDMTDAHRWNVDDTAQIYTSPPIRFENSVNYFTQTGAGDDTLPEMISVSLDKEIINTSSSDQVINATVTLAPEQYGKPRFIMFDVFSPATMAEHQAECTLTKTNLDGSTVWNCRLTIGLGSPKGLHPMMIWLADDAGNRNEYRVDTGSNTWFTNFEDQDGKITQITGLHLGPIGVLNSDK